MTESGFFIEPNGVHALSALRTSLNRHESLAVAVSGGVDSMTLAAVAHDVMGERVLMVHAVSPAVPPDATERVEAKAAESGWKLTLVDAGEFSDRQYLSNPVDRCYYCKSNLYTRIREVWAGCVASGANLDDLGDYRPGLLAAREKQVIHPLIDAGIDKRTVRAIASRLGLTDVCSLPAQPCLSSRIETGIGIDAGDLLFVHRIESLLRDRLGAGDVRCRITAAGVRIEVSESLRGVNQAQWPGLRQEVMDLIAVDNRRLAGFADYERGSAFLNKPGQIAGKR